MIGTQDQHARQNQTNLLPFETLWDKCLRRLLLMYNPGTDVTVDECLVPFRGRCALKQYMPSKI